MGDFLDFLGPGCFPIHGFPGGLFDAVYFVNGIQARDRGSQVGIKSVHPLSKIRRYLGYKALPYPVALKDMLQPICHHPVKHLQASTQHDFFLIDIVGSWFSNVFLNVRVPSSANGEEEVGQLFVRYQSLFMMRHANRVIVIKGPVNICSAGVFFCEYLEVWRGG